MENIGVYVRADKLYDEVRRSIVPTSNINAVVLRDTAAKRFIYALFNWDVFDIEAPSAFQEVELNHFGHFQLTGKRIPYALTVKRQDSPCLPGIKVIDYDVLDII